MRVALLTAGTRGDVEPFVALGAGLAAAGHRVVLAAPANSAALAAGRGVEFAPLRADFQALMESDEARAMLANPLRAVRSWRGLVAPMMRGILDDAWAAAQGAEVVVFHPKVLGGADIAERLGAAAWLASPVPLLAATRAFPAPGVATRSLGGALNRLSYAAARGAALPFAGLLRRWRRDTLGLSAGPRFPHPFRRDGAALPLLYAFSRHVVPPPPDWGPAVHVTGYWWLREESDWTPPPALARFLAAGPPPVYVGFGSIAGTEPAATTRATLEAIRRSGQRAVLAAGWGGLVPDRVPETVYLLDAAPHAWLFPRMAAVVHHGGAGTTAAGLRAGVPTVVCPFFGDQPFWGARVHALGAGPAPVPQRGLTPDRLADAIRAAVSDEAMRRRAVAIARAMRDERGVERAVELVSAAA